MIFSQSIDKYALTGKVFKNKGLASKIALKIVLGRLRRIVLVGGRTSELPHSESIVAHAGLEVCDGAHWLMVMKKFGEYLADIVYAIVCTLLPASSEWNTNLGPRK